jgi:FkbM family methyltransferase
MAVVLGRAIRFRLWQLAQTARIRGLVERADESLPQRRATTRYKRFHVVHDRSTSLITRVREQGDYEPVTTAALVEELRRHPEPVLLDVGANIGLVSLAVLAAVPDVRIYAFEPAPLQHDLLAETIRRNSLENKIELSAVALTDASGTAEFAVHSRRHAAGDGFVDTGRSGPARRITVRTDTLDRWWHESGRPQVDVIKLDVEGAELLVLRGAETVLRSLRPTLFLEIDSRNLAVYPYDQEDVIAYLASVGYRVNQVEDGEYVARPA